MKQKIGICRILSILIALVHQTAQNDVPVHGDQISTVSHGHLKT